MPATMGFVNAGPERLLFGDLKSIAPAGVKTPSTRIFCISSMNTEDWKFEFMVLYSG